MSDASKTTAGEAEAEDDVGSLAKRLLQESKENTQELLDAIQDITDTCQGATFLSSHVQCHHLLETHGAYVARDQATFRPSLAQLVQRQSDAWQTMQSMHDYVLCATEYFME